MFYDTACSLVDFIYNHPQFRDKFLKTAFPVDPFHHKGHSKTDTFCLQFTDPHLFPELQENGKWVFNASAAEMTNAWYGRFASIVRGMNVDRYNFFLEEMVRRRNIWTVKQLAKRKGIDRIGMVEERLMGGH